MIPKHPRLHVAARTVVSAVNTPLAKRRAASAVAGVPRPVKLEIGGLEERPGWLVTNVNATAKHYLDCTVAWPFEDGALDVVFADNVIEHVSLEAGRTFFAEAYRCLRPGGHIRLVTPDLAKHVALYLSGRDVVDAPISDFYRSIGLVVEHPGDLVQIPIGSFGHHTGYVYDCETLCAELRRAGFASPAEKPLGESDHPALAGLDLRSGESDAQMAVEAAR